jgi:hypothetical protein
VYPPGSWRYEIEYKGDIAEQVARALVISTDSTSLILNTIHEDLARVGVTAPWPMDSADAIRPTTVRDKLDNERRMAWLRTSVRHSIERLASSYSEQDILTALGLWRRREPEDHALPSPLSWRWKEKIAD